MLRLHSIFSRRLSPIDVCVGAQLLHVPYKAKFLSNFMPSSTQMHFFTYASRWLIADKVIKGQLSLPGVCYRANLQRKLLLLRSAYNYYLHNSLNNIHQKETAILVNWRKDLMKRERVWKEKYAAHITSLKRKQRREFKNTETLILLG